MRGVLCVRDEPASGSLFYDHHKYPPVRLGLGCVFVLEAPTPVDNGHVRTQETNNGIKLRDLGMLIDSGKQTRMIKLEILAAMQPIGAYIYKVHIF